MNNMILRKALINFFILDLYTMIPITVFADEPSVVSADQITPVRLCGLLKQRMVWGPPGFGETPKIDIKRLVWIVTLNHPTVFRYKGDNGKKVEEKLSDVQISLKSSPLKRQLHRFLGQPSLITGPLWSASSEGDTTPVVIEMATITHIAKSKVCN